MADTCMHKHQYMLYPGDLQIVELLLPFEDGFQSVQPDVDVSHQDTRADVDSQTVQCRAQVMQ